MIEQFLNDADVQVFFHSISVRSADLARSPMSDEEARKTISDFLVRKLESSVQKLADKIRIFKNNGMACTPEHREYLRNSLSSIGECLEKIDLLVGEGLEHLRLLEDGTVFLAKEECAAMCAPGDIGGR